MTLHLTDLENVRKQCGEQYKSEWTCATGTQLYVSRVLTGQYYDDDR